MWLGAADLVPVVAVGAGILMLVLAFVVEAPSDGGSTPGGAAIGGSRRTGRLCRSFAEAVARGDLEEADRLASRVLQRTEPITRGESAPHLRTWRQGP
jgi:hypothetical protein